MPFCFFMRRLKKRNSISMLLSLQFNAAKSQWQNFQWVQQSTVAVIKKNHKMLIQVKWQILFVGERNCWRTGKELYKYVAFAPVPCLDINAAILNDKIPRDYPQLKMTALKENYKMFTQVKWVSPIVGELNCWRTGKEFYKHAAFAPIP